MVLLDGKKVSNEIITNIQEQIKQLNCELGLAIIWVGNDVASEIYVRNKIKKCELVGIKTYLYHLDDMVMEDEVISLIDELNNDKKVNGILLQSPVPKDIDIIKCFNKISPWKDVDGFSNVSVGSLGQGKPMLVSCTPKGIIRLLDYYNISLRGQNVCIINRSNIVGKPLFNLLIERDATVTMCHSKTKNIEKFIQNADIVISAVGKPNFITGKMIKQGAIIVDVGISRIDGKVKGDVDFESVRDKCSYITPVPGGVGPMTIAMILENILETVKEKN